MGQIADVVLSESTAFARSNRLRALRASTETRLPYNAAFPSDELQVHFFSSQLWHDRIAFDPEQALARLGAPVLVLIGSEDPNTPMPEYLAAVRRGYAEAFEVEVRTLSSLMKELGHERLDVLKMDIEGSEYDVLEQVIEQGIHIDQILVEYHHQFKNVPTSRTARNVASLRRHGYRLFHIAETGREYSFVHERLLGS